MLGQRHVSRLAPSIVGASSIGARAIPASGSRFAGPWSGSSMSMTLSQMVSTDSSSTGSSARISPVHSKLAGNDSAVVTSARSSVSHMAAPPGLHRPITIAGRVTIGTLPRKLVPAQRGPPPRLEPKVLRRDAPAAGVRTRRAEGPRLHQSGQAAGERVGGDGDEQDGEGGAEPGRVDPGTEAVAPQRPGQRGRGEHAEQRPVEGDRAAQADRQRGGAVDRDDQQRGPGTGCAPDPGPRAPGTTTGRCSR